MAKDLVLSLQTKELKEEKENGFMESKERESKKLRKNIQENTETKVTSWVITSGIPFLVSSFYICLYS